MPAGPCDLERRNAELAERGVAARDRELGADEHHVHREPAAALGDEVVLRRCEHLGRRFPRGVRVCEQMESLRVDAHRVAYRLDLVVTLDRAREVELHVERHNLDFVAQSDEVPDGQHVVEPVDTDALAVEPVAEPLAWALGEDLILDPRSSVHADVARLCREDDRRLAVTRQHDIGVTVHDGEAREVRHCSFEAGVLGAAHDDRVETMRVHRFAHRRVTALDLARAHHDRSNPLTSAQIARFCGVGTPCSSPKRTIPPLRKSISVFRRASTSCSIDALWSYATSGRAAWSISSSGSASSSMPWAAATAFPSSTSAVTSARRAGSSHTRPCVRPVRAPIGFVDALKITLRHCGPRASATADAGMPPRVHASASRSISSRAAGRGSNGPKVVSPLTSHWTCPGATILPAGKVVPRITRSMCAAMASSLPRPFCTVATHPSVNACAVASIAAVVCIALVATIPKSHGGSSPASTVARGCPTTSPAPLRRSPSWLIASTCSCARSKAQTSTSSSRARFAANSEPTAPQPTTQTLMSRTPRVPSRAGRSPSAAARPPHAVRPRARARR